MAQIQEQIANARKANIPDQEIFSAIVKSPRYAAGFERARAAGLSNADIAKDLGLNIKPTKDLGTMPAIKVEAEKPSFIADVGSGMDRVYSGVAQGAEYAADGIRGGLNKLLGTNLETDRYERYTKYKADERKTYNEARKDSGKGANVGEFIGETVATLPLAALGKGYGAAKILSKPGLAITAQNAAVGGLVGGVGFAENAEQRKKNVKAGAIGGAVGGVVAKKAGDVVTKAVNIKQGRMVPAAQEIDELSKKFNVKTSVGDIGRNPIVQKTEVAMEQIPIVGTSKFRQTQHGQAKTAATQVVDALKSKLDDVDYKAIPKIQAAASAGDKNAIRIMGIVNGAGDDTGKILQAAAEVKNWRGQRVASQMYEQVGRLAGSGTVAPNKTVQAIDNVIAADSKVTPNKELLGEINSIRKNLLDPNINTNFKEMRAAQSRLGELVDEWGRQGKSTSGLTQIRTAIDDDILDFAQSSGNTKLLSELKRANALYGQLQGGKDKAFASSLRSDKPDEIFNQFMKVGKGDKAANFYKNLDPKGQAALRYQMAQNALDKATNESTGSFSPAKFALEFERMSAPYGNIFKSADKAQMDGFVKLMRHVERAGQYMENPPTGNRLVGVLMGGAAVMEPTAMATTGGIAGTLKLLFTTEAGKRILLAARDVPPNSPQMANLLMQAQKLATTGGANSAKD